MSKHLLADRELLYALADRVYQRDEEHRARGGISAEVDEKLLARARLRGWKPTSQRRAPAKPVKPSAATDLL